MESLSREVALNINKLETVTGFNEYILGLIEQFNIDSKLSEDKAQKAFEEAVQPLLKMYNLYYISRGKLLSTFTNIPSFIESYFTNILELHKYDINKYEDQVSSMFYDTRMTLQEFQSLQQLPWFRIFSKYVLWRTIDEENEILQVFRLNDEGEYVDSDDQTIMPSEDYMITILPRYKGEWREYNIIGSKGEKDNQEPNTCYIKQPNGTYDIYELKETRFLDEEKTKQWNGQFYDHSILPINDFIVQNESNMIFLARYADKEQKRLLMKQNNILIDGNIASCEDTPVDIIDSLISKYFGSEKYNENWHFFYFLAKNPKVPDFFPEIFNYMVYYPHAYVQEACARNSGIRLEEHILYLLQLFRPRDPNSLGGYLGVSLSMAKNEKLAEYISTIEIFIELFENAEHSIKIALLKNLSIHGKLFDKICNYMSAKFPPTGSIPGYKDQELINEWIQIRNSRKKSVLEPEQVPESYSLNSRIMNLDNDYYKISELCVSNLVDRDILNNFYDIFIELLEGDENYSPSLFCNWSFSIDMIFKALVKLLNHEKTSQIFIFARSSRLPFDLLESLFLSYQSRNYSVFKEIGETRIQSPIPGDFKLKLIRTGDLKILNKASSILISTAKELQAILNITLTKSISEELVADTVENIVKHPNAFEETRQAARMKLNEISQIK